MRPFKRVRAIARLAAVADDAVELGKTKEEVAAALEAHGRTYKNVKWDTIAAIIKALLAILFPMLLLLVATPAMAQCPGGVCRAPLAISAPAAPKADCQCDGCECAAPARPVIRSTYQPMPKRWRPFSRWRGR